MEVQRIAAFSDGESGGNPAGVVIAPALPDAATMQALAAEIGYSETVFAAPEAEAWRVRYFAPAMEVPFCGHATIALGAALALRRGDGRYALRLNVGTISVEGWREAGGLRAALQSPPTRSAPADAALVAGTLALFGLDGSALDHRIPPALAEAGARHLVLALRDRADLAAMRYDLASGRALMEQAGLVTIALVHAAGPALFQARNAFAAGGVLEDPATGAAAAALAGYLRDIGWPHGGAIAIHQGDDMGMPSRLHAAITTGAGESIRVSGQARVMRPGPG
ncbi:PhzF family phenazine biosynthesis protein [Roseomonas sp. SSH11]|uniref:PhzF family phenazine biosynthesis protein n=1 Tax=Pararoseomonas baculiformis TaxID=2820812 RepID=A0ABS4AAI6_9PROT|nr:PhzF family phenazine biosynthesis protein [Pararoseomonas baculiformis]MBP0444007.1 PhzF family phenazine biosynthesis protein [Pararoseomonas baculiformis]